MEKYTDKFQYIMLQQIFLFLFRTSKLMKKKTSKFLILDNFHVIFFLNHSVKLVNSRSAWQLLKHKLNKLSYLQMFILYLCDTRFYTYQ
jgi:maltodextrin utilization protein YvdJ